MHAAQAGAAGSWARHVAVCIACVRGARRLYIGLWHEAQGDKEAARAAITAAAATPYARLSGDYMTDLARVHCLRRGWSGPQAGAA
jgi:hypothetical protein